MKKIMFILFGFAILAYAETFQYQFPPLKNIVYNVDIHGNAGWASFDEKPTRFNVMVNFDLEILNLGELNGLYQLKITAKKSKICVNNDVFEDTTGSETQISSYIPEMLVQMDKNGKIYKTTILKKGLMDAAPFLSMFPIFPDTVKQGSRWTQRIESFNFPTGKIPQLEFTYLYEGKSGNNDKIRIISNQSIRQTTKQQDVEIKITGKNNSDGEIFFDSSQGIIKKVDGKMNLDINYMFQVPDPDKKNKLIPVPMQINLDLNFLFRLK